MATTAERIAVAVNIQNQTCIANIVAAKGSVEFAWANAMEMESMRRRKRKGEAG